MLVGSYNYKGHLYGIKAYDYGDTIAMYLSAPLTKDQKFLDKGITFGDDIRQATWNDLYVGVGIGNVKVDKYMYEDEGVKYYNKINKPFFSEFGSLLRGLKSLCTKENEETDEMFDIGFNPEQVTKYNIDNKGFVRLKMQTFIEIKYHDELKGIHLELEEDGSYYEKIFKIAPLTYSIKLDLSDYIQEVEDDSWDFGDVGDKLYTIAEIIERHPERDYAWLNDRKYHIVKTIEEVEEVCQKIWKHKGVVAFDTETTGLTMNITCRTGRGDRLVGMVFSITSGEAWYFPIAHKKIQNICTPGNENFIIDKYFKPILQTKDLVAHNAAFDWRVMYNYGICCNIKHDTMILMQLTFWNDHRDLKLGLKPLVKTFLKRDSFELSDFVQGKFGDNSIKFWDFDEESTKYYACPDTDSMLEFLNYCMDKDFLGKYGARKIYEIEVQFSIVIAYQEYYGHCVDVTKIDDLVEEIQRVKEESYAKMLAIVGYDFNPNSSVQMAKILIDELGYPIIERTDTGNPSTGKDTRKVWMSKKNEDGTDKYPMARWLQEYADVSTLESNFTKNIDKFATKEGFMFSKVKQFLETGRVSTNNPNYQSYSDTVKKYIGPREGYYAMDADYSSVEARIMVSMAGCQNMIDALQDPDVDYHTIKASDMFGVPYELVSTKLRKMSKGVNFGILYGLGDPNLGVNLYGSKTPENTIKAKQQKKLYFKGMEELQDFITKSKEQGVTQFFSTTYFERRRYFDPRRVRKDTIERQSCNARIQGTAADIYKVAMVRLFTELRKKNLLGKVLISAFVHDECYLEVSKSIDPCKMLKMLRKAMMVEIDGWCPLFIGAGFGRNWYEAKSTELPVQVQDHIVNTWGETGLDWWNGDTDALYTWEVNEINNYKKNRVLDYLKNEENWGKVFKPVENSLAHDVLDEVKSGVSVEGVVYNDVKPSNDMIDNLKEFCRVFDCLDLFEKADIQRPVHQEATQSTEEYETYEEYSEEDTKEQAKQLLHSRLKTLGVQAFVEDGEEKIYFMYKENDPVLMNMVKSIIEKNPGKAEVLTLRDEKEFTTNLYVDKKIYPQLLQLFISRANMLRK